MPFVKEPKSGLNMIKHVSEMSFWNGEEFVPFKQGYFYSNPLKTSVVLPENGVWIDLHTFEFPKPSLIKRILTWLGLAR